MLDKSFVGREIDESFIDDFHSNVNPCGENGEFHIFCFDGQIFKYPVEFNVGEKICRAYKNPTQEGATETTGF